MKKPFSMPISVAVLIAVVMPLFLSAFTTWAFSTIGTPQEGVVALLNAQSDFIARADQDGCPRVSRVAAKEGSTQ